MKTLKVEGRKGAFDDEGNLIIPFNYAEICCLNDGVYYARENFEETIYHLYTANGRLDYPKNINGVWCDQNRSLLAIATDGIWNLVEVDYKDNTLNKIYDKSIYKIFLKTDDLLVLWYENEKCDLFSRKQKKVIARFENEKELCQVNSKGFIRRYGESKSFYDLNGKKILEGFHDIKLYDDFLIGVDKSLFWRLYSYDGKELNPYKYSGNEYTDGINPCLTRIDGKREWIFITSDKIIGSNDVTQKLETADGTCLAWTFEQGSPICVYEDIENVILKEKRQDSLYKLVKDTKGNIKAELVFMADEIKRIPGSNVFFEVWKGRKRGVCNKNGLLGIPYRWQLFKTSYERIGDIEH